MPQVKIYFDASAVERKNGHSDKSVTMTWLEMALKQQDS